MRTIRDVAGEAGLKALDAEKAGTEVWIPVDPSPDHWMSKVFGHSEAQEICRRLTVIDADGKPSCGLKCYVGFRRSREDEFRENVNREIRDALLSGLSVRETTKLVRVSERQVSRQFAALITEGSIVKTLTPDQSRRTNATTYSSASKYARKRNWQYKTAEVDALLLERWSNKQIAAKAQVGLPFVRTRRKVLFASGQIKPSAFPSLAQVGQQQGAAQPPADEVDP
ncbi:hypothetical protein [Lichenibacterium ramalinae]|nr:hypothetical protein [Lichenibacterium ramalinae]